MAQARLTPRRPARVGSPRPPGPSDSVLVRGVGGVPARIRTKVLVAFVGIAVLALAVGLFGVRVLAQSNERVGRLGALQIRTNAFAKLESDTRSIRLLLNQNPGPGFYKVNPELDQPGRERTEPAIDQAVRAALLRLGPDTRVESLGFVPDPRERTVLHQIRSTTAQLGRASCRERVFRTV